MTEYIIDWDENLVIDTFSKNSLCGEIVRCRDCKHFTPKGTHKFESGKTNADYCKYVRGWMLQITPDGYCKWGERRGA